MVPMVPFKMEKTLNPVLAFVRMLLPSILSKNANNFILHNNPFSLTSSGLWKAICNHIHTIRCFNNKCLTSFPKRGKFTPTRL